MYKLDLHTHSSASPDGGIQPEQYEHVIRSGILDYVAITDHNRIDFALQMQKVLGNKIIVGEEIMTSEGELIGLFLERPIKPGKTALVTAQAIKSQGGIVYVPHPFETVRSGISKETLHNIAAFVDIIEVHNGRAFFQNRGPIAITEAKILHLHRAASSDAHGMKGLGTTYTSVKIPPTQEALLKALDFGQITVARPPLRTLLYPKAHRLRKRMKL